MQHRGGVEVLDGEWCSNPCPGRFTPKKIPGINCTEIWLEPKASQVGNREEKISCSRYTLKADFPTCIESLHRLRYPGIYWGIPGSNFAQKIWYLASQVPIFLRLPIKNSELKTFNRLLPLTFWTERCSVYEEPTRNRYKVIYVYCRIYLIYYFPWNLYSIYFVYKLTFFYLMFERNVLNTEILNVIEKIL
jgi:hypothetical protein